MLKCLIYYQYFVVSANYKCINIKYTSFSSNLCKYNGKDTKIKLKLSKKLTTLTYQ